MSTQRPAPRSCDTLVALPPATAGGCVIFGKNSDRPDGEVQEVIYRPAQTFLPGTKLQCTYIEIDQVEVTNAVILSKPAWLWGAEMGSNDKGVCIGNEAVWTKNMSDDDLTERLLGMDLVRLGLERGGTARECVDVITSLLETHGQGGGCSEGGSWAYHNSFLLADSTEAWVLETADRFWAAQRITEGVRNISNQLTIQDQYDLASDGLVEKATDLKLYDPTSGPFNFACVFDSGNGSPSSPRFCEGKRLLQEYSKEGKFGVADMMKILRDEGSGLNMGDGTTGSQVSMLTTPVAGVTSMPCCHWFTATPNPAISMFKPFIFGPNASIGDLTMSPDFGADEPRLMKPRFKKVVDRRHELYKQHEKLVDLVQKEDQKAASVLQNIRELESNCIADVEEMLNMFDASSFVKVSQLFEHMANIETNFYK